MANSTIIALVYPGENIADEVMDSVKKLQSEGCIVLEDACVVTKNLKNQISTHQDHNLTLIGGTGGALLGSIIGMVFLVPYVGAVIGAAAGALAGKLADVGIDDDFIKTLGQEIAPQTSALFLLIKEVRMDRVLPVLSSHGGKILHTTFTEVEEAELKKAFTTSQMGSTDDYPTLPH